MDLYIQYQAYCDSAGLLIAAFTTFRGVMKTIFKSHLRFRDKGDFGQCDVCHRLRKRIKNSTTKEMRASNVKLYSAHLLSQWADRQYYWNMRTLSRNYFGQSLHWNKHFAGSDLASSVLTCIQDGMDQAKLRIPKWGYQKISKAATKLYRPAIHLSGCWLHGYRLFMFLSDEDVKKNSETQIEALTLALQDLFSNCSSMAMSLHVQQDNCPREGKNKYFVAYIMMLHILGIFRFTSLGFLRTCHSHDDIDQAFGQVARLLMGKFCNSADELVSILDDAIQQGSSGESAGRIRGSVTTATKLDQVTCWKKFVQQLGVSFKGLRNVHYMRFCARKDLGSDVLDNVHHLEEMGQRFVPHQDDVFLVTKKWLADIQVQRAIAVMPAAVATQIRQGFQPPAGVADRRALSTQVVANLLKRVPICRKTGEVSNEGARYLLGWCQRTLPQKPKPATYTVLGHKWAPNLLTENHVPGRWQPPRRVRHFDLKLPGDTTALSDSSDSDDALELPIGFDP